MAPRQAPLERHGYSNPVQTISSKLHRSGMKLELDCLVGLAALRASGPIDIKVVGINITTPKTAENAILTRSGPEPLPAEIGIDSDSGKCSRHNHQISEN
jgi:hypothetical protein